MIEFFLRFTIFCVLATFQSVAIARPSVSGISLTDAASQFNSFATGSHAEKSSITIASEVSEMYAELIKPRIVAGRIGEIETAELEILFEAAYNASFYSNSGSHAKDMAALMQIMRAKKVDSQRRYVELQEGFVRARMFNEAASIGRDRGLQEIPQIIDQVGKDALGPTAFFVLEGGGTLERRVIQLNDGVVVIAHPNCHFSSNAVKAMESDPVLRELIIDNSVFLAPVDGNLYSREVASWNSLHPAVPIVIASSMQEWGMLDDWATPTFYFIRGGIVVTRVVGWPKGGRRQELIDAAESIGLRVGESG